jgi:hypothetical protein
MTTVTNKATTLLGFEYAEEPEFRWAVIVPVLPAETVTETDTVTVGDVGLLGDELVPANMRATLTAVSVPQQSVLAPQHH